MSKRTPYWVDEQDLREISHVLREDDTLLSTQEGRGIAAELGVAKTRFENGRFYISLARVLGKPKSSFPIRLSEAEYETVMSLPLSDGLKQKLVA